MVVSEIFVVFLCGKLTKLCHHAKTVHLNMASIINKNPKIVTKRTCIEYL